MVCRAGAVGALWVSAVAGTHEGIWHFTIHPICRIVHIQHASSVQQS